MTAAVHPATVDPAIEIYSRPPAQSNE